MFRCPRPPSGVVRYALSGEREAWKPSSQTSAGWCMFQPGSEYVGPRWHEAHPAPPSKSRLPRAAAAWLNELLGGFGAFSDSWYACSAGSLSRTRSFWPPWTRTWPNRFFAAIGNFAALSRRSSVKSPWPCISRIATNAFQYGIEPQPVYVWRFTPARPYAGGISVAALRPSGWKALPSMNSSASNLPGPHDARTFLTVGTSTPSTPATGLRFGAAEMIAPTLRSRLGQPSRRWPMPGANELFTVEWQTAQVNPIDVIRPEEEK